MARMVNISNKERSKIYYSNHRIEKNEYQKQYNLRHKEDKREYDKQYNITHKEKKKELNKKYYINNKRDIGETNKQWRKNNFEKWQKYMRKYHKKWQENNPEYNIQWAKNNKEKVKKSKEQWHTNKYKIDLKYTINYRMARAIYKSLKGNKAGRHWEYIVGYNLKSLMGRLKFTIPKGYNWNDFLQGELHIDHIIPKSVFNFNSPEHIDFKRCWALKNLQLLPANENIRKSNNLTKPFQPALSM